MSDREPFNRDLLDLLGHRGVVEIILALRDRGGSATSAELHRAGLPRLASTLRLLAVAGQVCRSDGGTRDATSPTDERFALTAAGVGLAETLDELECWGHRSLGGNLR